MSTDPSTYNSQTKGKVDSSISTPTPTSTSTPIPITHTSQVGFYPSHSHSISQSLNNSDSNSENQLSEGSNWSDWSLSTNSNPIACICLFCSYRDCSLSTTLNHMNLEHQFDLVQVKLEHKLGFYDLVKLVNYLRGKKGQGEVKTKLELNFTDPVWKQGETYLKMVEEGDRIILELEDHLDLDTFSSTFSINLSQPNSMASSLTSQFSQVSSSQSKLQYRAKVKGLKLQIQKLQRELENTKFGFERYRESIREEFLERMVVEEGDKKELHKDKEKEKQVEKQVNNPYFNSYAGLEIHEVMLKDKVRTEAYRNFMLSNRHLFKDKIVLDVGCGTGILSLFAAQAGAKLVLAVDNSDLVYSTMDIVRNNHLDGIIRVFKGKIEEVQLPVDQVDVVVSEWMGYALLFEAMFDSVLYARNRYLKPEGLLVPNYAQILVATVSDPQWFEDKVQFWKDVYGFDLSLLNSELFSEAQVTLLHPNSLTSKPQSILDLELQHIQPFQLDFEANLSLNIIETKPIHGLVIYFDMLFTDGKESYVDWVLAYNQGIAPTPIHPQGTGEGSVAMDLVDSMVVLPHGKENDNKNNNVPTSNPVAFSTAPQATPTHWKQTLLLLPQPLHLLTGTTLEGKIKLEKDLTNFRGLHITLSLPSWVQGDLCYNLI